MSITYSKECRETAKAKGLHLVTVEGRGFSFQGPVSEEESHLVHQFVCDLLSRRAAWFKARRETQSGGPAQS